MKITMKVNKQTLFKVWLAGIIIIFMLILIFTSNNQDDMKVVKEDMGANDSDSNLMEEKDLKAEEKKKNSAIVVDIKGAVKNPGVYELTANARVDDAITMAGGLSETADPLSVNLAERVYDEMAIVVLEANQYKEVEETGKGSHKIRINYASAEELMKLKGIGEAKAQAIIQYREENGRFRNAEELMNVSGIGEKTVDNFKDEILIP
ncbi:ComEA family DNA-binding protein [Virgibacillus sp. MSP4-1]|uniref:helix-hairpin-helix domain-containing protein n=1 Tax=Virgibacillus sp. MSP4-1 TaxID=2700081 RepID=UPI0003A42719|nr:helix-hairpin-helix domain-containing protein [Virgibacillus sp. MSP4-1]QHS22826.1 ComEA family DNA-binding protein [Virgibacillus sp. MSP4-1]